MHQNRRRLRVENEVIPISHENEVGEAVHNDGPLALLDNTR
jgi:hypothetical protein